MTISVVSQGRAAVVAGLLAALVLPAAAASSAAAAAPVAPARLSAAPATQPGPARIALPDGFRPEGITSAPGRRVFAGSLAGGAIWSGDLRTGTGSILLAPAEGRSLRGLAYDDRTNLVWAVGHVGADGYVWGIDAATGTPRAVVPVPGALFLNDLTITRTAIWVTDSSVDRLTRVPLDRQGRWTGAPVTFLPLGGVWPATTGLRANGIRELPDGTLLLDHSTAGGLWRVVPWTGTVRQILVNGRPAITRGDGLELVGTTLYVVRGSGASDVTTVRLYPPSPVVGGWSGVVTGVISSPLLDVPSTATFAAGRLWAVNARFGTPDPDAAQYWITRLPARP